MEASRVRDGEEERERGKQKTVTGRAVLKLV